MLEEVSAAGEAADAEPRAAPEPAYYLPDDVDVADATTIATWQDFIPDPRDARLRRVSMLWGFVREAIRDHLNTARRSQLEVLVPKWDATRPRTLLLLCHTTHGARLAEQTLRREIEPQIGKLLPDYFNEMQVVYAPVRGQEELG